MCLAKDTPAAADLSVLARVQVPEGVHVSDARNRLDLEKGGRVDDE